MTVQPATESNSATLPVHGKDPVSARRCTRPPAPIVFVDTETTDIGHRRQPWELAVIRREPDGTRRELSVFIDVDLTDANPFALDVCRFYQRHPLGQWLASGSTIDPYYAPGSSPEGRGALGARNREQGSTKWHADGTLRGMTGAHVTRLRAAQLWTRWTHGAHVIGAVPSFDTEVMGAVARDVGLLSSHHYHLADIENVIVGWILGRVRHDHTLTADERARLTRLAAPPWNSDALFAEVGVTTPDEDRHTALGDARTAERVWDALHADSVSP